MFKGEIKRILHLFCVNGNCRIINKRKVGRKSKCWKINGGNQQIFVVLKFLSFRTFSRHFVVVNTSVPYFFPNFSSELFYCFLFLTIPLFLFFLFLSALSLSLSVYFTSFLISFFFHLSLCLLRFLSLSLNSFIPLSDFLSSLFCLFFFHPSLSL